MIINNVFVIMKLKGLLLVVLLFVFASVNAHTGQEYIVVDGIRYSVTYGIIMNPGEFEYYDIEVAVVQSENGTYSGDIIIPENIHFKSQHFDFERDLFVGQISSGAFKNCTELKSISMPSIRTIGSEAFRGCTGLTSVEIPTVDIRQYAFYDCNNLTDVKVVGNGEPFSDPFGKCVENATLHVHDVLIDRYKEQWPNFKEYKGIDNTDFTITYYLDEDGTELYKISKYKYGEEIAMEEPTKEGYTFSGWKAYYGRFIGVDLPKNMPANNIIAVSKFIINKYKLTYLAVDEEFKSYMIEYGSPTIIPEDTPQNECFEFINWVDEIPETMPAENVDIRGNFKRIAVILDNVMYKFDGGNAIVTKDKGNRGEVAIASSVESDGKTYSVVGIAENVFKDNTNITAVFIPDVVTTIGEYAFNGCKSIATIVMSSTITSIGERAFAGIDKLTDVTIRAEEVPMTDRTAFENSYLDYVTLHVPYGSVDKYKAIGPWKDFKEIVAIEGTEPVYVETCAMPTISFDDGILVFGNETDGAECHYEIKVEDAKEGVGTEVALSSAYEITVYASKEGYNDSDKNTATLYWINVDPISTGLIDNEMRVNTKAILIQNAGGEIAVSGVADGDDVLIYNLSGQFIAQGKALGNHVEIGTNLSSGDVCIIKIGDKSVKYLLR